MLQVCQIGTLLLCVVLGGYGGARVGEALGNRMDPRYRAAVRKCDAFNAAVRSGTVPTYDVWWGVADHGGPEPAVCRVEWADGWHAIAHAKEAP